MRRVPEEAGFRLRVKQGQRQHQVPSMDLREPFAPLMGDVPKGRPQDVSVVIAQGIRRRFLRVLHYAAWARFIWISPGLTCQTKMTAAAWTRGRFRNRQTKRLVRPAEGIRRNAAALKAPQVIAICICFSHKQPLRFEELRRHAPNRIPNAVVHDS